MVVKRSIFFLSIALLIALPLIIKKGYWLLHSQKTEGVFSFEGMGDALDQIRSSYSVNYFIHGRDTVWFEGLGNLPVESGTTIPVRYQTDNPSDALVGTFMGIWAGTVIYGGIPLLVLLVIFLNPDAIPYRSKIRLSLKKPFIEIIT